MLTNLLFAMVGVVTTKVVGDLGASAVAAAGLGQQIFFGLQALLMAVSVGTTALVARAWGAGDQDEAVRLTWASLALATALAVVVGVPVMVWADAVAGVFGLDAEATAMGASYIRWLAAFNVAFAVNFIMNAALRAAGDARTPLWIGVLTNLVNIVLVYALVYGWWGFPAMGVAGAALAAGIAFTVSALAFCGLWAANVLRIRFARLAWRSRERLRQLWEVGYPAALEQGVFRIGFFIFFWLIGNYYGATAFAAYSIGVNILSVCFVVGFAFSIAGSTLVGQALGARDVDGAVAAGWRSLWFAEASMLVIGVLIVVFAEQFATFMIDDPEVVRLTVYFTWILGAMMPMMAVEFAIGGALRGAGDTRFPLKATMAGLIGMRCGLAVLFTALDLGVVWIYGALIGDYTMKAVMLLWRFRSGHWQTAVRTTAPGLVTGPQPSRSGTGGRV